MKNFFLCKCVAVGLLAVALARGMSAEDRISKGSESINHELKFEIGRMEFAKGDNITITRLRGSSDHFEPGATYTVEGTYTLSSQDKAMLGFFTTSIGKSGSTPVSPAQGAAITKGSGKFMLVQTVPFDGYLHVSFYDGNSFGGVYFGMGDRVWKEISHESQKENPNKALARYLGKPVPVPADLEWHYTKAGLLDAVNAAEKNAAITVKKTVIDDSEFPFLVGVICGAADAAKLKTQFKTMTHYNYGGSVGNDENHDGSDTCNTFNLTPAKVYPRGTAEAIGHRLLLRQQVFFDRLNAQNK